MIHDEQKWFEAVLLEARATGLMAVGKLREGHALMVEAHELKKQALGA